MLYFVPAWYHNNEWCENEQAWSVRRTQSEFDDTVKQIQLFHRSNLYPFVILLLSAAPNFRHFLHRQGTYRAPYWSCFDSIQEIRRRKAAVFSFRDLNWPDGTEFVYNPFEVFAMVNGELYAQIVFGEYGNMIYINMYRDGAVSRQNVYDDRGFIASTILYDQGNPHHKDYLMENGVWKIRYYYSDGHIEVNPEAPTYLMVNGEEECQYTFTSMNYEKMDYLIEEVLNTYLASVAGNDIFCIAMHKLHMKTMENTMLGRNLVLSFFKDRYSLEDLEEAEKLIEMSDYIVADSRESRTFITYRMRHSIRNITDISPFDTRVDLGISQQLTVQKVLLPVDGLVDELFEKVVIGLGEYLSQNKYVQVHIFTRDIYYKKPAILLDRISRILSDNSMEANWAIPMDERDAMMEDEETEIVPQRFYVEQCVSEIEVSKCIREQRLLIDLRDVPEMYLQISAISVCIPQIVRTKTQFIENGKNGKVIDDVAELAEVMRYYLDGLANWNEAAVNSYEIGKRFSTKVLINKWKGIIRSIG